MKLLYEISIPQNRLNDIVQNIVDSYDDPSVDDIESDIQYFIEEKLRTEDKFPLQLTAISKDALRDFLP